MNETDLAGEARELYDSWRRLGLAESAAMDEVTRSGLIGDEDLVQHFIETGLSPEMAKAAARGRASYDGHRDPFNELVESFQSLGLSPEAAKHAAIGGSGSETEARREAWEARAAGRGADQSTQEAAEAVQAFAEAVAAAARFHDWPQDTAVEWIKRKVREEMAGLPLREAAVKLRDYAGPLAHGSTARQLGLTEVFPNTTPPGSSPLNG